MEAVELSAIREPMTLALLYQSHSLSTALVPRCYGADVIKFIRGVKPTFFSSIKAQLFRMKREIYAETKRNVVKMDRLGEGICTRMRFEPAKGDVSPGRTAGKSEVGR